MTIPDGTRLGSYQVVAPLGAGGMGEVYRAIDTKLHREVAIKVLAEAFAKDEERLARLEREARVLASLNHANIAAIYGLEKSEDLLYLILELVEGQTLRERFTSSPLRVDAALNIFYQVARALEAAHERGVVHRDLKPENVKITPERVVKVLDFGLAKPYATASAKNGLSQSPTATFKGTSAGLILGTPAYMSPEQARGESVDKRTDIWSFGCCLYEALAGQNPFQRATVSEILAGVLESEPDWSALPRTIPWSVARLLCRCLHKDREERLHDIADARIEIGEAMGLRSGALTTPGPAPARAQRTAVPWALAAVILLLVGALASLIWTRPSTHVPSVRLFATEFPATGPLAMESGSALALSPDGRRLVYVAQRGEKTQLFTRALDQLESSPIPGTEDGSSPFFSPDGSWLGFLADGKLKKAPQSGGSVLTLGDAPALRGASWGENDRIVFSPTTTSGLSSITAAGGSADVITQPDFNKEERSHRWPDCLPGGKGVIFTTWKGNRFDIELMSFESEELKALIENGTFARYVPTGHIVFARDSALFAVPFDVETLEVFEPAVSVLEGVAVDPSTGAALFSFDREGLLAYVPGGSESFGSEGTGKLLLVDRQGIARSITETLNREFRLPRLSPDGRRLMVAVEEEEDDTDLWITELGRGTLTRVTLEASNAAPVWSPDGKQVVFSSNRGGPFNLYRQAMDGKAELQRLTTNNNYQIPTSWSSNGKWLAYGEFDAETGFDMWLLPMTGDSPPKLFLQTPFDEVGATFSPDGRWLAYVSNETGQNEVYVSAFPEGEKRRISSEGGTEPLWASSGRELFFRDGEWIMAVRLETEPELVPGSPTPLFEAPYADSGAPYPNFDVTPDGRSFVMIQNERDSAARRLIFIENWFQELKNRVPGKGS